MGKKLTDPSGDKPKTKRKTPPALTSEARENQLISLAYDLVEKRLREGTATSQETTHFLKMGSTKEKKELEMMERQMAHLIAKTEALETSKHIEELYANAITAMKEYKTGRSEEEQ